jgi:hypothetical protein
MRVVACLGCGERLWALASEARFVPVAQEGLEPLKGIPPPRTGQLFCPLCGSYKMVARQEPGANGDFGEALE